MPIKRRMLCIALLCLLGIAGAPALLAKSPKPVPAKKFDAAARAALAAMKAKAAQLNIAGVAVVSFAPGDTLEGWSSQMAVVGRMLDTKAGEKGNNLLAIAYAKAAEMARTGKDSGTSGLTPMTGEFGWQGGVTAKTEKGFLIVAFSGGKSEDDVEVSKAGLAALKAGL
ncbi:hypothetical protein DYQ86_25595 [Acidobacteria bacterium AB60]|nr:hypothetical protein DYQ86_25595 [Acidobacteria bacterium AB60]